MPWGVKSNLNLDNIRYLAMEGKREDGRSLRGMRDLDIQTDVIGTAEGSALVRLGKTLVMVGVKVGKGDPYTDNPDEGVLITTAQVRNPFASFTYGGNNREDAIELARVVDRGIRSCGAVDLEGLCIESGECVWVMFLDIQVLNDDGNLFDAAGIAATAALTTAKLPEGEGNVDLQQVIQKTPIPVTMVKIEDSILVDPNSFEEDIAEARITITTFEGDNISSIQKGMNGAFTPEELERCAEIALEKGRTLRERIKTII